MAWGWSCKLSGSDLLPRRSQTWVRTWLRPTPSVVPDSCPDPQRFLVPAYSFADPRPMPRTHKGPRSGLLPQSSQSHTQTHRGPGSGLVPSSSQTYPRSTGVLSHVYSLEGLRFMPGPTVVSGSDPLPQQLLPCTCSCRFFLVSGLLWPRWLAQSRSS